MLAFGIGKCWFSLVCVENGSIKAEMKRCDKDRLLGTPLIVSESLDSIFENPCKYKGFMA